MGEPSTGRLPDTAAEEAPASRVADDELSRSEREYRALFENARDAILIVDPKEEVVVDANRHACELYGFPRAELVGVPLERLWRDPPADRGRLSVAEQGQAGAYESRHARKDGSEITGYLFDRRAGKTLADSVVRLMLPAGNERPAIPYSEMSIPATLCSPLQAGIEFTSRT